MVHLTYIERHKRYLHGSRLAVIRAWFIWPISFRVTSLALGQSYDCPSASEVILKDMGQFTRTDAFGRRTVKGKHRANGLKANNYSMTSSNGKKNLRYLPFVRGIHRSLVDSPHKGRCRGALIFFYLRLNKRLNSWANNRDAGYLRRHRANYDVTVMR